MYLPHAFRIFEYTSNFARKKFKCVSRMKNKEEQEDGEIREEQNGEVSPKVRTYAGVGNIFPDAAFKETTASITTVDTIVLPVTLVTTDFTRNRNRQSSS